MLITPFRRVNTGLRIHSVAKKRENAVLNNLLRHWIENFLWLLHNLGLITKVYRKAKEKVSRELTKIAPFPITQPNLTLTRPQSSSKQRCRQLTQASATGWEKSESLFLFPITPFFPTWTPCTLWRRLGTSQLPYLCSPSCKRDLALRYSVWCPLFHPRNRNVAFRGSRPKWLQPSQLLKRIHEGCCSDVFQVTLT